MLQDASPSTQSPPLPDRPLGDRLRRFAAALHGDCGGAAVSFILTFPIFLWILAILFQYALLVNAKVTVNFAAQQAARAAVTSLPQNKPQNVRAAAYVALAALSPKATATVTSDAQMMYQSLQTVGVNVAESFPARYAYAAAATDVSWNPTDLQYSRARDLDVRVHYRFCLTVPGAKWLVGYSDTVAGIDGRFQDLISTCRVETSHSRQTVSGGSGWPN